MSALSLSIRRPAGRPASAATLAGAPAALPRNDEAPGTGHVGRIVAGSITGGLIGAVALVAGPFAGAREHVVTGSVLLTFAFAWATLALDASYGGLPARAGGDEHTFNGKAH